MADPQLSNSAGRGFLIAYGVVYVVSITTAVVFAATGAFTAQQLAIVFTIGAVAGIVAVVFGVRIIGRARRNGRAPDDLGSEPLDE